MGKYVEQLGEPRSKLLYGIPFCGRAGTSWKTTNEKSYALVDAAIDQTGKPPAADADGVRVRFEKMFKGKPTDWSYKGPATVAAKT